MRRPFRRGANAMNSTGSSKGWSPSRLAAHAGALPALAVLERACGGRHSLNACPCAVQDLAACGHTGDAVRPTLALFQPASGVLAQRASRRCHTGHGGRHVASGHRPASSVTALSSWRPVTRRRAEHSQQAVGGPGVRRLPEGATPRRSRSRLEHERQHCKPYPDVGWPQATVVQLSFHGWSRYI